MVLLLFKLDLKLLQEIIKGNKYPNVPRKLIKAANQNDVAKKKKSMQCVFPYNTTSKEK